MAESRIERAAFQIAYDIDVNGYDGIDDLTRIISPALEALIREAAKVSCYQWSCNTADKRDEESNRYPGHDCECVAPQILEHFGLAPEEEE